MLAPTSLPASRITGVSPLVTSWRAADSPMGPAPITATGSAVFAGTSSGVEARWVRPLWQPQSSAGAEQQAPVSGFGVGSPQQALAGAGAGDSAEGADE